MSVSQDSNSDEISHRATLDRLSYRRGVPKRAKSLDETITDNALAELRRKFGARKRGGPAGISRVARSIASSMVIEPADGETQDDAIRREQNTVERTLRRYLGVSQPKTPWRVDLLEEFANAIAVHPARLMGQEFEKVPAADYVTWLATVLGRNLDAAQAKQIRDSVRAQLEIEGMFDLVSGVVGAILASKTATDAATAAFRLLDKSDVWIRRERRKAHKDASSQRQSRSDKKSADPR